MFDDLLKNIAHEKQIIQDLKSLYASIATDPANKQFYLDSAGHLLHQLRLLNRATPELLKVWSPLRALDNASAPSAKSVPTQTVSPQQAPPMQPLQQTTSQVPVTQPQNVVKMSYVKPETKEKHYVTINKEDKREFLEKLKLSESGFKDLRKIKKKSSVTQNVVKPSMYARISNIFFRGLSESVSSGFTTLEVDLKKSNSRFPLNTYLSMTFFSTFLGFLIGVLVFTALMIINTSNWTFFSVIFLVPALVFGAFYLNPASEANAAQKKISQELPFAAIHMAAIAGSDITPVDIFKIIAKSKEYPHIGKEIRKVVVQVEVYGYDLVASLKNVAVRTSNKMLAELFTGIATNISTGGALKTYLQKKSENFLLDYKLERQKYTNLAGTFMDVYISILIAAPLVLMMMFIVMNVAGLGTAGLSITALLFISIGGIVIINIIFIFVLNIKQPKV